MRTAKSDAFLAKPSRMTRSPVVSTPYKTGTPVVLKKYGVLKVAPDKTLVQVPVTITATGFVVETVAFATPMILAAGSELLAPVETWSFAEM